MSRVAKVVIVVRHIYGPEDVLVLESKTEDVPLVDVPDYGLAELLQDLHAAGLAVEGTGMAVDYGFEIDGSQLLVDDSPIIFPNVDALCGEVLENWTTTPVFRIEIYLPTTDWQD